MEQNNNSKEMAKLGVKVLIKRAMAPFYAVIWSAILTILPYLLVGSVIVIVILCFYFGTMEQIDEVFETIDTVYERVDQIEERVSNAVSLHGFKTNEELDHDEEVKFFYMLNLYKKVFKFDNKDLSILSQTLLYEGSAEERIYLSESSDVFLEFSTNGVGSGLQLFVKNLLGKYQRGFFNTYASQSQYLKANKNMFINAVALNKCKSLTNNEKDKKQCFKGYLVAEYNVYADLLMEIDANALKTDVEPGYLVYDMKLDIFGHIVGNSQDLNFASQQIGSVLSQFTVGGVVLNQFREMILDMGDALNIVFFGKLADADDKHYFYDGYIVKNLKEEYKVYRHDEYDDNSLSFEVMENYFDANVLDEERKNRKQTADDILDMVDAYYELTYGVSNSEYDSSYNPSQGDISYAAGTSCSPISSSDSSQFGSPVTGSCQVNSCFGVYGGSGGWTCKPHKGIDVNAANGIYSVCNGTVSYVGMYNDGSASAVEVQCSINGKIYTVRYLHMPMEYVNHWEVGNSVSIGQYIGEQGDVGKGVTGAHLHLDISVNGAYVNPEFLVSSCGFNIQCSSSRESCSSNGLYYCK